MVIGSPNYLNLSPYRISSPVRSISAPIASHWFLIQVISSIIDLSTFGNSNKIYFSSENMVANGWFRMYLNEEQIKFLKSSTYFELYPIEKKYKISPRHISEKGNYYVHASPYWAPPTGSRIISRISDTIFLVHDLIIDQNIRNDPRILEINPTGTIELLNRYVSGFLQGGHQKSVYHNNIFAPIRPLHDLGINGTGQVINVVDSGVDLMNAFFYDPDPSNNLDSITGKTNLNHRKVIRIEPYVDNLDIESGHGTHVAGTAAGSCYCEKCGICQYNGVASGSKLYFSDIGDSRTGETTVDFDLAEQAEKFKELDVHVSSNSWGYSQIIKEVELGYNKIAYDNPYVLYLFAAGNSRGYNTMYCPSSCKNIASVGSVEQVSATVQEFSFVENFVQNETHSVSVLETMERLIRDRSVADPTRYFINLSLVQYRDPSEAGFDAHEYYKNSAVLLNLKAGDVEDAAICSRAKSVIDFGAEVGIYVPTEPYFKCDPLLGMPMVRAREDDVPTLASMSVVSVLPSGGEDLERVPDASYQSSKGPADTGLSKPDISTPGANIYSAYSHGPDAEHYKANANFSANVIRKSGTSMATPSASGLAALVVQYMRDGFYPLLTKRSGASITPSSCLLRAVLVNTAQKPPVLTPDSKSAPRNDVGFGVPCLERALGFGGNGFRFVDNETMQTDSHVVYTVSLDSNSCDLSVTLVYLDPPLSTSNDALLFADLDLYVKTPDGHFYMGNNVSDGECLSLIERVIIDRGSIPSDGGLFEIHVMSSKYPIDDTKVPYSIAVNGPFDQVNTEKNPLFLTAKQPPGETCPNDCNGNGKCVGGKCVCDDDFTGPFCSLNVEYLRNGDSVATTYAYKQIKYYRLPLTGCSKVSFDIVKSFNLAPVYFCSSFDEDPGKVWNSGWECHLSCPLPDPSKDEIEPDDYPYFQNISIQVPPESNSGHLSLALYSGYYDQVKVTLNSIAKEGGYAETPTQSRTPKKTAPPVVTVTNEPPVVTATNEPPVVTDEPSSSSGSTEIKKKKFPTVAIVLVTLVLILTVAAIVILVLVLMKKNKSEKASTISVQLLSENNL